MSDNTVKDNRSPYSGNSPYNAIQFMIDNAIRSKICTADIVTVVSVDAGGAGSASGYVSVRPLVCQVDNYGSIIAPVEMFRLPYMRVTGGVAALVIDPQPGDIGIAIYTKRDSSGVGQGQTKPVPPGSYRMFDQADGFYVGGFLNTAPSIYLELDQDNNARLVAPESVTIQTKACNIQCETFAVNASVQAGISAPNWSFSGSGGGVGSGTINANLTHNGNTTQTGSTTSTGDHVAAGISLASHVHGGVESGGSNTGGPR